MGKIIERIICILFSFVFIILGFIIILNEIDHINLYRDCKNQFKTDCRIIAVPIRINSDITLENEKFGELK